MDPLEYLYSLKLFGMKLDLSRMNTLMNILEYPHKEFKNIHVAGTNGKGSVCAFLASVLQEAGYKVGLYTSPHLIKFNERIQVNGRQISDEDLALLVDEIRTKLGNQEITFFEITTTIAFEYFKRQSVDIAIIEVGLGGRLDATNVITPEISVITNISLEHTNVLGNTKKEIALEKAGIIKRSVPVVLGDNSVYDIISEVCEEKKSDLILIDSKYEILNRNNSEQIFNFENKEYTISLLGEHQVKNGCIAIKTIENLKGFDVTNDALQRGLKGANWPGRLQFVREDVLVDGAHNVAGMKELVDFLKKIEDRRVLILAISQGKDVTEMVKLIVPLFERIIITQGNFKPEEASIIAQEVKKYCNNIQEMPDIQSAIQEALKHEGLKLFTGSLYMVGDILKYFKE